MPFPYLVNYIDYLTKALSAAVLIRIMT